MAKKSKSDGGAGIFIVIGLPIIIFSFFFYKKLSNEYLQSEKIQKVNDIKRVISYLLAICGGLFVLGYIEIILFNGIIRLIAEYCRINSLIFFVLIFLFCIPIIIYSYYGAKYIAIIYLGILFDFEKKRIICPYDFESYGLNDYLSFKFLKTFTQVHCIPVKELTKITRGYGNELYLHGKFGSNKIKMSSKQKRDECLAIAAELVGKKGITFSELESY